MKTNTIITIGRQYGSGGKEIGHFVAEAFGIKLYDKEMLARAAKESGICEELFETHDEKCRQHIHRDAYQSQSFSCTV